MKRGYGAAEREILEMLEEESEKTRKMLDEKREMFEDKIEILRDVDIDEDRRSKLYRSSLTLSDMRQKSHEQWMSEFSFSLQDATELTKAFKAKKPRSEEPHYVREENLAHRCFKVPFEGSAHQVLHNQLIKLRGRLDKGTYYSPYCALVQSSGVGKSRALMELSQLGVYVCYCSLASSLTTAYPPRTVNLAEKLVNTFTEGGMVLYLKAWLQVLAARISTVSPEAWQQQQLPENGSPGLAMEVYNEWMNLERQEQYTGEDHDSGTCKEAIKSVQDALQKKCTQCAHVKDEGCSHSPCNVIFAFDEAKGLQERTPESGVVTSSPFYQIRRALRVFFDHQTFFAIMLDTSAKVTNLLPTSKHNENSSRAISMGFKLAHPIYFLPNMSLFRDAANLTAPECYEPDRWLKQGRPMWCARLKMENDASNVRYFALQKLVQTLSGRFEGKGVHVDVLRGTMVESQAMALLAATAGLSICARSELAELMAASHMNLILRVSEDRSRIYIGLPAEPILAEGAASALRDQVVQVGALKHLLVACKVGYVTPGPRGEFVAKFILVAAMWDVKKDWQLRPIPVGEYLEKLLVANDENDKATFDKVKAQCPEQWTVFFNSFVLVRKPPTTGTLQRAFVSGYALMYRAENTLPGIDMIIPVWTPEGMTCIVVSVKNLKRSGWLEKVSLDKVKAEFTQVEVKRGLFCITIVMSLREPDMKDSDNWVLWESPEEARGPYMNLTCYGIDGNYSYLTKEVKELLKAVLITVPDELAGATNEEKEWIQGLLPEQYFVNDQV